MLHPKLLFRYRSIVVVLILITLMMPGVINAQDPLAAIESRWKRGDYSRVLQELVDYRERTGDKSAKIDYMIATSACRCDRRESGYEFFQWILYNYGLSPENRSLVELEMGRCQTTERPAALQSNAPSSLVGLSYHGKGGFEYTAESTGNTRATVIKPVPVEDLAARLFGPSAAEMAVKSVQKLLGSDYRVESHSHFVVAWPDDRPKGAIPATTSNQPARTSSQTTNPTSQVTLDPPTAKQAPLTPSVSDPEMARVSEKLDRYLKFYLSEYSLTMPAHLITVCFARNLRELNSLAEKLHGIQLAKGSIAYSSETDQTMVGWASGQTYGTFAHELFHLVARNGFGDIPPWLDEGTAALYEVSEIKNDRIAGLPNWRGEVLQRYWEHRPAIGDLVRMNRSSFDDAQRRTMSEYTAGEQQAVNHATARYFILYLQEQKKLKPVFDAFRKRPVTDKPDAQAVALLESVLGKTLDKVDADFAVWFKSR
jgi:hypothetical protein